MKLLDILYPKRCALCDRVIDDREYPVCLACRDYIHPIEGPRCMHCSKPISSDSDEFCLDCKRHKFSYDCGFAAFLYRGRMKDSLMKFKYGGRQEYSVFYGQMLNLYGGETVKRWRPEVLIPVPVHSGKLSRRGYNQAEVLALEMGEIWGIPVDSRCVKRIRKTRAQKNLDDKERRKNLREAFRLVGDMNYRRVLIVDDIYTTGSTVDALAKIFKENGVEKVYYITVCIGRGI